MSGWRERVAAALAWFCGWLVLAAVLVLLGFLLYRGWGSLSLRLIFGQTDPWAALTLSQRVLEGLFPALAGTVLVVLLSVGWALPVGIAAGIYLAEFAGRRFKALIGLCFDLLAAIPSIVIGLFGLTVTIFLHRIFWPSLGPCLLVSAFALGILVLPYLVRTTQLALEGCPLLLRQTGLTLGASGLQNLWQVVLPQSLPRILGGVILSLGRAAEDTAVIMLTGVVATAGLPESLLDRFEALPFYIYYLSAQYSGPEELRSIFGAALLLLLICSFLFVAAHLCRRLLARRWGVG